MKNIIILGSTGSIGTQTLDVVRNNPDKFKVKGITCNSNIELLEKQINEFKPDIAAVFNKNKAAELRKKNIKIEILSGIEGIIELAKFSEAQVVLNALVGSIGIKPTIAAIKSGKDIALANKETLVSAGELVMNLAKKHKVNIKPVDSEHSAIFQCLQGQSAKYIKKIILTCSGGAFRNKSKDELKNVNAKDALRHPNWDMGNKITIDSATLMNKGFEVIEAKMMFDVEYNNIDVVIHPESIVHSFVEFNDSSVIAQLGLPDMRLPIQYALSHPNRISNKLESLNLSKVKSFTFYDPDLDKFPCLKYAYEAGTEGGTMPCVLNAANEVLVSEFLKNNIQFMDIPKIIKKTLDKHKNHNNADIETILETDKNTRAETLNELNCLVK